MSETAGLSPKGAVQESEETSGTTGARLLVSDRQVLQDDCDHKEYTMEEDEEGAGAPTAAAANAASVVHGPQPASDLCQPPPAPTQAAAFSADPASRDGGMGVAGEDGLLVRSLQPAETQSVNDGAPSVQNSPELPLEPEVKSEIAGSSPKHAVQEDTLQHDAAQMDDQYNGEERNAQGLTEPPQGSEETSATTEAPLQVLDRQVLRDSHNHREYTTEEDDEGGGAPIAAAANPASVVHQPQPASSADPASVDGGTGFDEEDALLAKRLWPAETQAVNNVAPSVRNFAELPPGPEIMSETAGLSPKGAVQESEETSGTTGAPLVVSDRQVLQDTCDHKEYTMEEDEEGAGAPTAGAANAASVVHGPQPASDSCQPPLAPTQAAAFSADPASRDGGMGVAEEDGLLVRSLRPAETHSDNNGAPSVQNYAELLPEPEVKSETAALSPKDAVQDVAQVDDEETADTKNAQGLTEHSQESNETSGTTVAPLQEPLQEESLCRDEAQMGTALAKAVAEEARLSEESVQSASIDMGKPEEDDVEARQDGMAQGDVNAPQGNAAIPVRTQEEDVGEMKGQEEGVVEAEKLPRAGLAGGKPEMRKRFAPPTLEDAVNLDACDGAEVVACQAAGDDANEGVDPKPGTRKRLAPPPWAAAPVLADAGGEGGAAHHEVAARHENAAGGEHETDAEAMQAAESRAAEPRAGIAAVPATQICIFTESEAEGGDAEGGSDAGSRDSPWGLSDKHLAGYNEAGRSFPAVFSLSDGGSSPPTAREPAAGLEEVATNDNNSDSEFGLSDMQIEHVRLNPEKLPTRISSARSWRDPAYTSGAETTCDSVCSPSMSKPGHVRQLREEFEAFSQSLDTRRRSGPPTPSAAAVSACMGSPGHANGLLRRAQTLPVAGGGTLLFHRLPAPVFSQLPPPPAEITQALESSAAAALCGCNVEMGVEPPPLAAAAG